MQIVTDHGMDLTDSQREGLDLHLVPLQIELDGKTYKSGKDVTPEMFYELLQNAEGMPTTSQPTPSDFADLYRRLAEKDPDILSVHMSAGLSGTYNSARLAAEMVPEANVTLVDTKTLSCPCGWQVQAAAQAIKAGWPLEKILAHVNDIRRNTDAFYTLDSLRYLIHGGRISHLSGLVASLLNIKPIITVNKDSDGKYATVAKERTLKRAIRRIAITVAEQFGEGANLRLQLMHGQNPEGVEILREELMARVKCNFEPTSPIAPVLGAHTGPTMVAVCAAPMDIFQLLPQTAA
ncbi:MAG: DegV family protein [Anaerolineaceae bacterium]|jgi:DegV family protein with EDD domain|nr:DegV family protein [Anaerolineaceae bacterium]